MAKLLGTFGASLDTVQEGANYIKDRISVIRYDAIFENFQNWHAEKRAPESVPPHLREDYTKYCKSKKSAKQENEEE